MIWIKFLSASAVVVYGAFTTFRKRMPLFYKIIVFAMASFWLGICYQLLGEHLLPAAVEGFHVGYLGYAGMFFFLLSSYYGAIDSLIDGGEKCFRKYRVIAAMLPALMIIVNLCLPVGEAGSKKVLTFMTLLPAAGTAYYAGKHLIMPDVDMGIIKVMREYNAVILCICILHALSPVIPDGGICSVIKSILESVFLVFTLPLARKGVQKWYI